MRVILTQLAEKRVGFVGHDVVITQTGAHKHFFNLGQGAHLAKQLDVIRVIDDHIRAGLGEQALAACARADFELLIAGGAAAFDDAKKAYEYVLGQGYFPGNIIAFGESVGGGLAVSNILRLIAEGKEAPQSFLCSLFSAL